MTEISLIERVRVLDLPPNHRMTRRRLKADEWTDHRSTGPWCLPYTELTGRTKIASTNVVTSGVLRNPTTVQAILRFYIFLDGYHEQILLCQSTAVTTNRPPGTGVLGVWCSRLCEAHVLMMSMVMDSGLRCLFYCLQTELQNCLFEIISTTR